MIKIPNFPVIWKQRRLNIVVIIIIVSQFLSEFFLFFVRETDFPRCVQSHVQARKYNIQHWFKGKINVPSFETYVKTETLLASKRQQVASFSNTTRAHWSSRVHASNNVSREMTRLHVYIQQLKYYHRILHIRLVYDITVTYVVQCNKSIYHLPLNRLHKCLIQFSNYLKSFRLWWNHRFGIINNLVIICKCKWGKRRRKKKKIILFCFTWIHLNNFVCLQSREWIR